MGFALKGLEIRETRDVYIYIHLYGIFEGCIKTVQELYVLDLDQYIPFSTKRPF